MDDALDDLLQGHRETSGQDEPSPSPPAAGPQPPHAQQGLRSNQRLKPKALRRSGTVAKETTTNKGGVRAGAQSIVEWIVKLRHLEQGPNDTRTNPTGQSHKANREFRTW